MKKSVLALSIAAAVGGLGFTGGALAVTDAPSGSNTNFMQKVESGVGHILVVPYYTAQTEHATLINIVNTDTNGKAVKVRFRAAANSDDVYDFQVFLSPGDVWAANVSQDAATGLAKLTTNDSSCTKPANVNGTFVTQRLRAAWTAEKKAENTREGYVEILNMADIPATRVSRTAAEIAAGPTVANELFTAIKHVKGATPPCSGSAWTRLDTDRTTNQYLSTSLAGGGMLAPTSGLMGNWSIINVNNAAAWGSTAKAFRAGIGRDSQGVPSTGNLVYFPQTAGDLPGASAYTADPLFVGGMLADGTTTVGASLKAQLYDVPDLSTPYFQAGATAADQAQFYTASLAATEIKNEYLTDPAINATTDWVISMPSRRYAVAVDYEAKNSQGVNTPRAVYGNAVVTVGFTSSSFFSGANTALINDQVCIKNIKPTAWDRSEQFTDSPTEVVISPNPLPQAVVFCGEASILTFNNPGAVKSGVLNGTVAFKDVATNGWTDGWANLLTPSASALTGENIGLPVLGGAFVRATAGASSFGVNWDHRYERSLALNPDLQGSQAK